MTVQSGIHWKHRFVLTMLFVLILLLIVTFIISDSIYISQLEKTNLQATMIGFQQTERNLERKMGQATESVRQILSVPEIDKYLFQEQEPSPEATQTLRKVVGTFDDILRVNLDLDNIMIVAGKGEVIGRNRRGNTIISSIDKNYDMYELMSLSNNLYPSFFWFAESTVAPFLNKIPYIEYFFEENQKKSSENLVGIRTLYKATESEEACYLILSISGTAIEECYAQALYEENEMLLIDRNYKILSALPNSTYLAGESPNYISNLKSKDKSGNFSFETSGNQNQQVIYYPMNQYGWILVNEVPKTTYETQASQLRWLLLLVWISAVLVMSLFFILWIFKYIKPIEVLMKRMKKVQTGDLKTERFQYSGIREMDELGLQFNTTIQKMDALLSQVKTAEDEKRIEELKALQYQINPHFLSNSLNTIRWMAVLNNNIKVADAITILAKIIEPVFRNVSDVWTLREELDFVENYIRMLTLRYGKSLDYDVSCQTGLMEKLFPRFVLQPVLENCFTHGQTSAAELKIRVQVSYEENVYRIIVTNSGKPIDPEDLRRLNRSLEEQVNVAEATGSNSIGLHNVNKRLQLIYGVNHRMWLESSEETGTTVYLEFSDQTES